MSDTRTLVAGRYRLGAEIGRGGMGVVWEAYDELLHRPVAVKELHYPPGIDDAERDRLAKRTLREARAVAAVEDPHAVRVFDIVEQDGRPWIVMELARGRTLTDVLRDRGPLPPAEVSRIGLSLVEALDAAHRAGVLHRDVKPSNVILRDDGRVALTDFGIATMDNDPSELTTSGKLVGSPAFMAPERVRGEQPTPASDLWSLGATLWTAAEGSAPFAAENAFATMARVITEEPPTCGRCRGDLADVIQALMDRDPHRRPTVQELRRVLGSASVRPAPEASEPYPTEPLPPSFDRTVALPLPEPARAAGAAPAAEPALAAVATPAATTGRRRWPLVVAAVVVLALAAVVLVAVVGTRGPSPSPSPSATASTTPRSSAAASTPPASASNGSSDAGAPSGWRTYTDAAGWKVAVPSGWAVQHQGSSVFFRDPAGGRYLQVDTKYPAGPSAKGAWEDQERSFRRTHSGYQRIRLENVDWRGYPDVADWEFTYTSGAVTLHAVDRGAVVDNRGYGLFFQTHADQWDASQDVLDGIYASFQP